MSTPTVEIVATGNELLTGDVLDTNTNWLCRHITGLGGKVIRATVTPDDPEAIESEVRTALARKPDLLLVTGGLGPTEDDLTLAAVARALGVGLREDPAALEIVRERYAHFARLGYVASGELTESRAKMARLPEGSVALHNPVGAAPGALVERERTTVVCLPGVPAEMKAIFNTSLQPVIERIFGAGGFAEAEVIVGTNDESLLAPVLSAVAPHCPEITIKSRPRFFGREVKMRVVISARGGTADEARASVEQALSRLREALNAADLTWEERG